MANTLNLHWISLTWATFGLITDETYVVEAPPIAWWTIGKSKQWVFKYYLKRGATLRSIYPGMPRSGL